ncbi:MAG: NfeD family protein [Desulfobacterales bacterium]|nr:NfeD family protein [Desulfobacterales bacterium]
MTPYILPIALQVLGIIIIVAEIFIPSLGLLSALAATTMGYSLYLVFTTISPGAGWLFVTADLILVPILIYFGIRILGASPLALQKKLSKTDGVVSQAPDLEKWIGKEGIAATDLRPAGMATLENHRLDVVTDGSYIEKGTPIRVTRVTGNQILVTQMHKENPQ